MKRFFLLLTAIFAFATANAQEGIAHKKRTETYSWALERLGVPAAVKKGLTGKGIVVAVIDNGILDSIAYHIPVIKSYDVVPLGAKRHGTLVAAIIASDISKIDNQRVAVAPGVKILDIRVEDSEGEMHSSSIAQGIIWAVDNGADIINMSLEQKRSTLTLEKAVTYAEIKGVLIVAGAGNITKDSPESDVGYPAACAAYKNNVVAVGASNEKDNVASFSKYGKEITLIAPGSGVYSVDIIDGNKKISGTSMAAPHITGIAALILEYCPEIKNASPKIRAKLLKDKLIEISDTLPGLSGSQQGYGMPNVEKLFLKPCISETTIMKSKASGETAATEKKFAETATETTAKPNRPAPANYNLAGKTFCDELSVGVLYVYFFSNNYFIEEIEGEIYDGHYTFNATTKQGVLTRHDGKSYKFQVNVFDVLVGEKYLYFGNFMPDDWTNVMPTETITECKSETLTPEQEQAKIAKLLPHKVSTVKNTDTQVGVEINGITWATANAGTTAKTFVSNPEDYGGDYTWEEAQNACPTSWRLPTQKELKSLADAGSIWTTQNGINGRKFGKSSNSIFLPAAGWSYGKEKIHQAGTDGGYWSSTKYLSSDAYSLNIKKDWVNPSFYFFKESKMKCRCVKE
ncbi:MAG: S8 family serine peptidase [Bacteroidetes bacterium]|nr:S8 family serine peptidase [Bacteroidota bacterium]